MGRISARERVYGMGGVGKTTLVNQVVAPLEVEKSLYEVVMPVVTEKNVLDAKEFQEEMAKVLNMKPDDQWNQLNVSQRAVRIFKRLTQNQGCVDDLRAEKIKTEKKTTIVILDDLRAKLDLEQVGIPFGAGIKGCKILFTSRHQFISYAGQKKITLGVLKEEEAWMLFQKITGDVLEDPDLLEIGKKVTRKCEGLPILIVTVAGALLQHKSKGVWKDALISLQRKGSTDIQEFVDSALKFISFNHLSYDNKKLFLLCGLLGGGEISIFDQLLRLGMGWGLFKHTKSVAEARNNLETLIHDLKASFLLLDGQSVDSVRMHDVVRDVAIKIARNKDHNMLLESSEEWPKDDMLSRCTALTFPYGIVPPIPECLVSPSLEFLLLYHNNSSLKITDNIFEKMQKLAVLDIKFVELCPKLPSSLASLENLHTLSLNLCKLGDISVVGALKNLKTLSLNSTNIEKLPMEIRDLSELRVLDLNGCSKLEVIPPGIIQSLSRLEELLMAKSFSHWEVDGQGRQRSNASLDELNSLHNLTTLRIHIPDAKLIPADFYFKSLERYTMLIGDEKWEWGCHDEESLYRLRGMKIKDNSTGNIHLGAGVQEMIKRTEILYLDGMKNIHELEWKTFRELKFVHIQHSDETRYIVNATEHQIWPQPGIISFKHLTELKVEKCDNLKYLFTQSIAMGLEQLNFIRIKSCESLKEIVAQGEGEVTNKEIKFPRLVVLELGYLPCLTRFCSRSSVVFPTLESLAIYDCSQLETFVQTDTIRENKTMSKRAMDTNEKLSTTMQPQPLFNEKVEVPRLKELELESLDSIKIIWHDGIHEDSFRTLKQLTIRSCSNLLRIFPSTMLQRIQSLKELYIENSCLVEEIFEAPRPHMNGTICTQLSVLCLDSLPRLKCVWTEDLSLILRFSNLSQVIVQSCQSLKYLFSASMAQQLHHLKELRVHDCLVETIVGQKEGEVKEEAVAFVFHKLAKLWLSDLPKLKSFYPGRHTTEWPSLEELELVGMFPADLLKFTARGGDSHSLLTPILEKIESLTVRGCPGLTNIVQGLVSFKFLAVLHVWYCDGLLSLVQISTAKSLVQLTTPRVGRCKMMKEIVASESRDGAEDQVVFSKLETLELEDLPSLINFCHGNYVLKFPLLEEVTVRQCLNMKTFCGGITITPKLNTVYLTGEDIKLVGFGGQEDKDLNTIIQKEAQRLGAAYATSSFDDQSDPEDQICENSTEPSKEDEIRERGNELGTKLEVCEKAIESGKNVEVSTVIVKQDGRAQRREEIEIYEAAKAGNEAKTITKHRSRPSVLGSLIPTPDDIVDVTCSSSQSHHALGTSIGATTSPQDDGFEGLEVAQHLVPLLEKARDKHGDFHTSPLIKLKTVRITAMEAVGQVLHILQTQPPRTIDEEKIQFMEDAFHDLSNMSFPIEWLHPLIDKARKCFLSVQRRTVVYELKAKIDEMEEQLKILKREMEVETALVEEFDEEMGFNIDLDQPLLDI